MEPPVFTGLAEGAITAIELLTRKLEDIFFTPKLPRGGSENVQNVLFLTRHSLNLSNHGTHLWAARCHEMPGMHAGPP